jgi:hypothetical protein
MRAALIFRNIKFLAGRMIRLSLFAGMWVGGASVVAVGQPCVDPVFGVSAVKVDQRAETASLARDAGAKDAAERAFTTVLGRLLVDQNAVGGFLQQHSVEQFLDFVHIIEENTLEKRYIAKLDFCFDATRLRQAMIAADLRWAELRSPNILVLPIWRGPDGVRAWDRDNKWITGWWEAVPRQEGLLTLQLLQRNLINERRFTGEALMAGQAKTLARAAALSNAQQLLVVEAALDFNLAVPEVTVTTRLYDRSGQFITTVSQYGPVGLDSSKPVELAHIRSEIIAKMSRSWQLANLIDGSSLGEILVHVPAFSLREWTARLRALDEVAVILSYDVVALDTQGGMVRLRLAGSQQALQNALAAHRLKLVDENGRLTIAASFGAG